MNEEQQFIGIIALIKQSRVNAIKAVNTELINLYWNIGSYITLQLTNAKWGEKTVDELADFIKNKHPELKGFNRGGLYRMKQFYDTYADSSFVSPVMTQIQIAKNKIDTIVSLPMTQLIISRTLNPAMIADYQLALPNKKLLHDKWQEILEMNENGGNEG